IKDNTTQLYPNEQVSAALLEYSTPASTLTPISWERLPRCIADLHAWGVANHEKSNYMISRLQAQLHIWMIKTLGTKRILEIGTSIGYSTLCRAHAVGPSGHVTTLKYSPEYTSLAKKEFEKNGVKNVQVIVGDAERLKTLATSLDEPFDLIFIDADKASYPTHPTHPSLILSLSGPSGATTRLLRPGGIIVADNILRSGLVADHSPTNPWAVKMKENPA
ncbi:S-adenosyl-L-methionine-dependent methyltransferase, partial [Hyaloscypha bicolor E]